MHNDPRLGLRAGPRSINCSFVGGRQLRRADVPPELLLVGDPVESDPMWTAYNLEQSWISERTSIVNDVALYLTAEQEDQVTSFLKFWRDKMEVEIVALTPDERSLFIWKIIEDTMRRVRAIESGAIISRTVH
jgi:hypothetical protein